MNQTSVPLFDGENYSFRCIKMKTLLKSHGLWEAVEQGVTSTDAETLKKDARAMCLLQQGMNDVVFPKITAATNAKEAWNSLATAYEGNTRVKAMKLQGLRTEFETLKMKSDESVQMFLTRVQNTVNQRRVLGDQITDETIVTKVLRSLTSEFDHVVATIEESKDLTAYTLVELTGSLQTHESRLKRREDSTTEQAFYMRGDSIRGRGRGRTSMRGGRGRRLNFRGGRISVELSSRSGKSIDFSDYDASEQYKKRVKCYNCNQRGHYQYECPEPTARVKPCYYYSRMGHIQAYYIIKQRDEEQASFAQKDKEEH